MQPLEVLVGAVHVTEGGEGDRPLGERSTELDVHAVSEDQLHVHVNSRFAELVYSPVALPTLTAVSNCLH